MLARSFGKRFSKAWHSIGDFALAEGDGVAFRAARAADAAVQDVIETAKIKQQPIDWKKSVINHTK